MVADPYDENRTTVLLWLKYAGALKLTEAASSVRALLENEPGEYFDGAVEALGEIGDKEDAQFLAEYFGREGLSVNQRQTLMRALGKLKADDTFQKFEEIARDEDESVFLRISAVEAIGNMQNADAVSLLLDLYNQPNPNFRAAIIGALANFDTRETKALVQQAIRDEHYRVRLEAIAATKKLKLTEAVPFLLSRAKNDPESSVKYAAFDALATLGTGDGRDFLLSVVTDKKSSDTAIVKAAAALLATDAGISEITALAQTTLKDDKRKSLRYALGQEFVKYDNSAFAEICREYLASKDVTTQGIGLDMYAKGRYASAKAGVQAISENEKAGVNRQKAVRVLAGAGN
jgi:HEAT repeat protein